MTTNLEWMWEHHQDTLVRVLVCDNPFCFDCDLKSLCNNIKNLEWLKAEHKEDIDRKIYPNDSFWYDFTQGKFAVHCPTKQLAMDFLLIAKAWGCNVTDFIFEHSWAFYEKDTCYNILITKVLNYYVDYECLEYNEEKGIPIVQWEKSK